jgi:hypothetical protein
VVNALPLRPNDDRPIAGISYFGADAPSRDAKACSALLLVPTAIFYWINGDWNWPGEIFCATLLFQLG